MELSQDNVQVASKSCAPLIYCISDIHNTQVDEDKNRRKRESGSIRISDIEFGNGLEILSKFFLRKLFFV